MKSEGQRGGSVIPGGGAQKQQLQPAGSAAGAHAGSAKSSGTSSGAANSGAGKAGAGNAGTHETASCTSLHHAQQPAPEKMVEMVDMMDEDDDEACGVADGVEGAAAAAVEQEQQRQHKRGAGSEGALRELGGSDRNGGGAKRVKTEGNGGSSSSKAGMIRELEGMGFTVRQAERALMLAAGDLSKAVELCLSGM